MNQPVRHHLLTFLIVAGCSTFFCSKGVFAKLSYAEGVDPITLLALRMGLALPFFLGVAFWTSRQAPPLAPRTWLQLALLGFVGYYLSSVVNFHGLRFISVGLERMVLFTYPGLVLLGSVLFRKRTLRARHGYTLALAYGGIVLAFLSETGQQGSMRDTALGTGLVFLSALTYALFITVSGTLVNEVGALRFTSLVVSFSAVYLLLHFGLTHREVTLWDLPAPVYAHGIILALLGTVIPSFLLGVGLKRAGPERFAILGTVGPVTTLILAWLLLRESLSGLQIAGFLLSLGGSLAISLTPDEPPS